MPKSPSDITGKILRSVATFGMAFAVVAACLACATSLDESRWAQALGSVPLATGTTRTFEADVDHTVAAISDALQEARFDQRLNCQPQPSKTFPECYPLTLHQMDDSTSVIYATKIKRGFYSGWTGTQARFVVRSNARRTTVTVVSMYQSRILEGSNDYSREFLRSMEKSLKTAPQ